MSSEEYKAIIARQEIKQVFASKAVPLSTLQHLVKSDASTGLNIKYTLRSNLSDGLGTVDILEKRVTQT